PGAGAFSGTRGASWTARRAGDGTGNGRGAEDSYHRSDFGSSLPGTSTALFPSSATGLGTGGRQRRRSPGGTAPGRRSRGARQELDLPRSTYLSPRRGGAAV